MEPHELVLKEYAVIQRYLNDLDSIVVQIDALREKDETVVTMDEKNQIMQQFDALCRRYYEDASAISRVLKGRTVAKPNDRAPPIHVQIEEKKRESAIVQYKEKIDRMKLAIDAFKDNRKKRQGNRLRILAPELDEKQLEIIVDTGKADQVAAEMLISDELSDCIREIEQRHQMVLQLERSIREIYELFKDLAVLVEIQGEAVNGIEEHIQHAKHYVEEGEKHLGKADEYQRTARNRQCFIVCCCFMILFVIVMPIVLTLPKDAA